MMVPADTRHKKQFLPDFPFIGTVKSILIRAPFAISLGEASLALKTVRTASAITRAARL